MRAWRRVWRVWREWWVVWMWVREGVLPAQWAWCIVLIRQRLHSLGPFPAPLCVLVPSGLGGMWYSSQ